MYKLIEIIKVALSALTTNKLRSSLTILGIVVGIFSIIAISTVIAMLQTSIEEGVSALNKNTFQIQKWPAIRNGGREEWAKIRNRKDISLEEYEALKTKLNGDIAAGAELWNWGKRLKYNSEETNPNVSLAGVTPEAFLNNEWIVEFGRDFNLNDLKSYSKIIVLGRDVADRLFEFVDPVGQEIWVDGKKLRVVGILEKKGDVFGQSQDNFALIPITTYQTFYGKRRSSVNITIRVPEGQDYNDIMERTIGHMRTIRKVAPGEENDFSLRTNEAMLERINDMTSGIRIGALVIAAIALLAAGIGIMNIMLVSVTERTKEIGIRKAIGANKSNIMLQFITEAITLCIVGGLIGIILGLGVGLMVGAMMNAVATIPLDWVVIGILLCVLIGVTFGTYPAAKAANLDPIEALRFE